MTKSIVILAVVIILIIAIYYYSCRSEWFKNQAEPEEQNNENFTTPISGEQNENFTTPVSGEQNNENFTPTTEDDEEGQTVLNVIDE